MKAEIWAEIKRLWHVEKWAKAAIARQTGVDRKTVRCVLRTESGPEANPAVRTRPSILDPYKGYIQERIKKYPDLPGTVLFEEIKRQGYMGKIRIVTEYLATLRPKTKEVFLRIETPPGEQAQVDWAHCGTVRIGNALRKLSCFVMVLSWSRMMYIRFTLSQSLDDFIQCHVEAFKYFNGVPRKILYDNLKLVVLSRIGSHIRFNEEFMTFAGVLGFEPVACNVARGNEKGKVESGIFYIRKNLLEGRTIAWPQIQREGKSWLDDVANVRVHRTTRERPVDRWEQEKPLLIPLPGREYEASRPRPVSSTHQALVRFDGNAYSVPHKYAHQPLILRATQETIRLFVPMKNEAKGNEGKEQEIACHGRSYDRGIVVENPKHFEGILALKKKAFATRIQKSFLDLGHFAGDYLEGLCDAHVHLNPHLFQIMQMVATYGREEVGAAVKEALEYKAFGAAYVQNILLRKREAKGLPEITPLHIPQKPAWNEIVTEEPDLSLYDKLME